MCRDYERQRSWRDHRKLLETEYERRQRQSFKVITSDAEPNNYRATDTNPTDPAPIVRLAETGEGLELATARWWFVPASHKGTFKEATRKLNTFNARDDNIGKSPTFRKAFASRRCLVPASGWYEWTEPENWKKGKPKTKWRFTLGDHEPIFFAGIWDRFTSSDPAEGIVDTFALITHEPGAGVIDYHDRAPIVLPPETWADWMDPHHDAPLDLLPKASVDNAYTVTYVSGPEPLPLLI